MRNTITWLLFSRTWLAEYLNDEITQKNLFSYPQCLDAQHHGEETHDPKNDRS